MALLILDWDAPGRTLEWRRVSPALAPRGAPGSRVRFVFGRLCRRGVRVDFLAHTPLSVLGAKSMFAERIFFARPVPPELRAAETPCYLMKLRVSA